MSIGQYNNNWTPPSGWSGAWQNNYNPYQPPQLNTINQQPVNNLLRVTGPESAKAYSLPPNSNVVLFDAENPIFYWKSTDDSGFATLRTFIFEEQKAVEPSTVEQMDTSNFATKDDLSILKDNILEMKELLEGLVN